MNKNRPEQSYQEKELTEGEEVLSEYFLDEGIKFTTMKIIPNLPLDNKSYREADFYLPEYGLYVEFFGQWNVSEEHKKRYREKKQLYAINRIPCVYIYPENLGILKYVFNNRARLALKKFGTRKAQLKFGWYQFAFNIRLEIAVIMISLVYLFHFYGLFNSLHYLVFNILVGVGILAATYDVVTRLMLKFKDK